MGFSPFFVYKIVFVRKSVFRLPCISNNFFLNLLQILGVFDGDN